MVFLKIIACAFSMSFYLMCVLSLASFMIEPFFYTSSVRFDDPIEWLQKKFAYFLFFWIFFCWICAILAAFYAALLSALISIVLFIVVVKEVLRGLSAQVLAREILKFAQNFAAKFYSIAGEISRRIKAMWAEF